MHFFGDLIKARQSKLIDTVIECQNISFRRSELKEQDWRVISRVQVVKLMWDMITSGSIGEQDAEEIIEHMFPSDVGEILESEDFDMFLYLLVEKGQISNALACTIKRLRTSVEEFKAGILYAPPTHAPRIHSNHFWEIPTQGQVGNDSYESTRQRSLRHLIEAATYQRKEWKGLYYAGAVSSFKDYYRAYECTSRRLPLPPSLHDRACDWSPNEKLLLRRGNLVLELREQLDKGILKDYGVFKEVRAALIPIRAQCSYDPEEMEKILQNKASDPENGLAIGWIPRILELHPEAEGAQLGDIFARAVQFENEEKDRLAEIENAKAEYKKYEMMVKHSQYS